MNQDPNQNSYNGFGGQGNPGFGGQNNPGFNGQSNPGFGGQNNPGFGETENSSSQKGYNPNFGNTSYSTYQPPIEIFDTPQIDPRGQKYASTSMTLGIISLVCSVLCCCIPYIGLVLGILAVVFACLANRIGTFSGATPGMVCGIIGIVLCAVLIILSIISKLTGFTDAYLEELTKELQQLQ